MGDIENGKNETIPLYKKNKISKNSLPDTLHEKNKNHSQFTKIKINTTSKKIMDKPKQMNTKMKRSMLKKKKINPEIEKRKFGTDLMTKHLQKPCRKKKIFDSNIEEKHRESLTSNLSQLSVNDKEKSEHDFKPNLPKSTNTKISKTQTKLFPTSKKPITKIKKTQGALFGNLVKEKKKIIDPKFGNLGKRILSAATLSNFSHNSLMSHSELSPYVPHGAKKDVLSTQGSMSGQPSFSQESLLSTFPTSPDTSKKFQKKRHFEGTSATSQPRKKFKPNAGFSKFRKKTQSQISIFEMESKSQDSSFSSEAETLPP